MYPLRRENYYRDSQKQVKISPQKLTVATMKMFLHIKLCRVEQKNTPQQFYFFSMFA